MFPDTSLPQWLQPWVYRRFVFSYIRIRSDGKFNGCFTWKVPAIWKRSYCWWLKSGDHHLGWCWNPINNGKNYLPTSTGEFPGFQPSGQTSTVNQLFPGLNVESDPMGFIIVILHQHLGNMLVMFSKPPISQIQVNRWGIKMIIGGKNVWIFCQPGPGLFANLSDWDFTIDVVRISREQCSFHPGWLFDIGYEILPNYMRIIS